MSPYVSPWISLRDLADRFNADEEWKLLISDGVIGLRGRYCDDYTTAESSIVAPYSPIAVEYFLNCSIDVEAGRLTANRRYSNDPVHDNYTCYEDVQASENDFLRARKAKMLTTKVGRPTKYDWAGIERIFRAKAPRWQGSLTKFIEAHWYEFADLDPQEKVPDRSGIIRRMSEVYKEVREP